MEHPIKKQKGGVTYSEYLSLPESKCVELIDGELYDMSPPGSPLHSEIITNLVLEIGGLLREGHCKVHAGQLGVSFPRGGAKGSDQMDVVIPDIVVVCDQAKIDGRGCKGAPDLIIEVLSPSSTSHDQVRKLNLYEQNGVPEFWIVQPEGIVMVFSIQEARRYGRPRTYDRTGKITSGIPGLTVDLKRIFPAPTNVVREKPRRYRIKGTPRSTGSNGENNG